MSAAWQKRSDTQFTVCCKLMHVLPSLQFFSRFVSSEHMASKKLLMQDEMEIKKCKETMLLVFPKSCVIEHNTKQGTSNLGEG